MGTSTSQSKDVARNRSSRTLRSCLALAALAFGVVSLGCSDNKSSASASAEDTQIVGARPARPSVARNEPQAPSPESFRIEEVPLTPEERASLPGVIAFVSERDGTPRPHLMTLGRSPRIAPLGEKGTASYPSAFSAKGDALLAIGVREQGEFHEETLQLYTLPSGKMRTLGKPAVRTRQPSFTPDGKHIVFDSSADVTFAEVFRIGRDGKGLTQLTSNEQGNFEPTVSSKDGTIAFTSSRDGNSEIYRMAADGKNVVRLTSFHREDLTARFAPDGTRIAFVSTREGTDRIYVMGADGSTPKRVHMGGGTRVTAGQLEESWEADPIWAPDGKSLVFSASNPGEKPRLWRRDFETGKTIPLTDGRSRDEGPAISPDSKYLCFSSDRTGDVELWVMRMDGTGSARLTEAPGADWRAVWGPALPGAPGKGTAK